MILSCPDCSTRFALDAEALRPNGRRVKCGKCAHIWFADPPPPSLDEPVQVTPLTPEELSSIPSRNLPAYPRRPQKTSAGGAWAVVAVLVIAVSALAWFGRVPITKAWPPARSIYETAGLKVFPAPGEGLTVDMDVRRAEERLTLVGEVINTTGKTLNVPLLYVVLSDSQGKLLRHWSFSVSVPLLGPGERMPFTTELDAIPEGTQNVSVLFTNPEETQ